jgi:serine/threonine-protein kinase RsbW
VAEPSVSTRPAATLPLRTWERTFAAVPSQVSHARQFLADLVGSHELADDATICLSELATNAVIHSDSRNQGGTFGVRVIAGADYIRVEVTDAGGAWRPAELPSAGLWGRGLAIVAALATSCGVTGGASGRTAWCEVRAAAKRASDVS